MKASMGIRPETLREYRKARRESQFHFWSRFGVTQSRGSRFELGAEIPPPVAILLTLYFDGVVTDGDLQHAGQQYGEWPGKQGFLISDPGALL